LDESGRGSGLIDGGIRDVQVRLHSDSVAQRSACRQAKKFRSIDPTQCPGVALEFRARRYERSMSISARPTQIYDVPSKVNARPIAVMASAVMIQSRDGPKQAKSTHARSTRHHRRLFLLFRSNECSTINHRSPSGASSVVDGLWDSLRSSTAPIDGASPTVQAIWGRTRTATSLAPAATATVATSIRMRWDRALP